MKISVAAIIRGHWRTLHDAATDKLSISDIIMFYFIPIILGGFSWLFGLSLTKDFHSVSITFFGIFIALLLNIQVAIFGIFLKKWDEPNDKRDKEMQAARLQTRKKLLSEINTNISYLIVVGTTSLCFFVVSYISSSSCGAWPAVAVSLYLHFILTFMMILKRSHSLFQQEYDGSDS